jgi:hypothetical protein
MPPLVVDPITAPSIRTLSSTELPSPLVPYPILTQSPTIPFPELAMTPPWTPDEQPVYTPSPPLSSIFSTRQDLPSPKILRVSALSSPLPRKLTSPLIPKSTALLSEKAMATMLIEMAKVIRAQAVLLEARDRCAKALQIEIEANEQLVNLQKKYIDETEHLREKLRIEGLVETLKITRRLEQAVMGTAGGKL